MALVEDGSTEAGGQHYTWTIEDDLGSDFAYTARLFYEGKLVTTDFCNTLWGARWSMGHRARRHHRRLVRRLLRKTD